MGFEFTIEIDSKFGKTFNKIADNYNGDLTSTLEVGIKAGLTTIAESARANHRFQNDTYVLQNEAIQEDVDYIDQLWGAVKIDPIQASYGERIHEGFATWKPDPFIHDAGKREEKTVRKDILRRIGALK